MTEKNNAYLNLRLIEAEDLCNLFVRELQKLYSEEVAQTLAGIIVYDVVEASWTPHQKPKIQDPKNLGSISLFNFTNELQSLIEGKRTLEPAPSPYSMEESENLQYTFDGLDLVVPISFCESVFNNVKDILDTDTLYILWNDHPETWSAL